jgi:hypothetical protein
MIIYIIFTNLKNGTQMLLHTYFPYRICNFSEKKQRTAFSLSKQHRLLSHHSEQVRKNRIMLTHLIKVICVSGKLGFAFYGHNEPQTSVKKAITSKC